MEQNKTQNTINTNQVDPMPVTEVIPMTVANGVLPLSPKITQESSQGIIQTLPVSKSAVSPILNDDVTAVAALKAVAAASNNVEEAAVCIAACHTVVEAARTGHTPPPAYPDVEKAEYLKKDIETVKEETEKEVDPWALTVGGSGGIPWSERSPKYKVWHIVTILLRLVLVLCFLYLFICSLDLLGRAFQLIGGRTAGKVLKNSEILKNPVCGLMIGVLVTVLLQSSSTSTSIIVTLVAANMITVRIAIPIVMGANIGTSVTNTIVSLAQADDRDTFRRAFGGATVHDMFNWLAVIILLPIEAATGYLYHLTSAIVKSMHFVGGVKKVKLLKVITEPFANLFVILDKKVIEAIAVGNKRVEKKPLLKYWCKTKVMELNKTFPLGKVDWKWVNETVETEPVIVDQGNHTYVFYNGTVGVKPCSYLFHGTTLPEAVVGVLVLLIALFILITCLVCMVKTLNSLLKSSMAGIIKKTINADFPGCFAFLTGYVAILVGAGVTVLVQSSSVFTSALTPLVGMGVVTIERVYPLTLGSNIGTTTTSILAALTASGSRLPKAIQISFCHLFFNITGIVIFYPIPFMRKIPIMLARKLGNTTANYRWFSLMYLFGMFFLLPVAVFGLSLAGLPAFLGVLIPILVFFIVIIVINILQSKAPRVLPKFLKSWEFLPKPLHSLEPYDRVIDIGKEKCACCKCCKRNKNQISLTDEKLAMDIVGTYESKQESGGQINPAYTLS